MAVQALLLAALGIAACDSAAPPVVDVPPVTSEPPVPLQGHFATLSRDADGAVRFTTTDVETGEVTHTPMVQFENLPYVNEMWVSPDGQRALFRGSAATHSQPTYIANVDGTEARRVEFFSYDYGGAHWQILAWSPDSRSVLCLRGGSGVAVVRIGAGNVLEAEPVFLVLDGAVAGRDTIRTVRGIAWGDDDDHVVVAGSTRRTRFTSDPAFDPAVESIHDLDIYAFRLPDRDRGPAAFERKLTTRPIRAVSLAMARGGRAAVARLGNGVPHQTALVTEGGTRLRPIEFPDGYAPSSDTRETRWDVDGRRVVLYQPLRSHPAGLIQPFSIGVLDSEDPDLEWREYGNTLVGAQTLPFPLLRSSGSR